jgi:hypothetical protein
MKRVRASSSAEEEEEDGGGSARAPEKANEFDRWLIRKIYGYAEVRDSDAYADVTKKYTDLQKRFDGLLEFVRNWGFGDDHWNFCNGCGRTNVIESRNTCYLCTESYVSCFKCGEERCASGKHPLCFGCARMNFECDGRQPDRCTEHESDDEEYDEDDY